MMVSAVTVWVPLVPLVPLIPLLLAARRTRSTRYRAMSRVWDPWENNEHLLEVRGVTRVDCAAACDREVFCLSFYHSRVAATCLLNPFVIPASHLALYHNNTAPFLYFRRIFERWPRRCADIKAADPTAPDADYWLYPSADRVYGNRVRMYCKMSELVPREYLTLPNPNRGLHPPLRNLGCGGETSFFTGQEGDIVYSKIRLDPDTMLVDNEDFTYATWSGSPIPYGEAGDCYTPQAEHVTPDCGPVGYFRLEFTDTGMKLGYAKWTYTASTYMSTSYSNLSDVTVYCGGLCGYCDIKTPGIYLAVDRSQLIHPDSAIFLKETEP